MLDEFLESIQNRNNRELVDDAKEEQTICVIVSCQKSGIFAFM